MELKKIKSVNTVAFFNILGPVILNGINFFTIPIFTRVLGTANYGLYTIYITWVNTFTIIVSLQVAGTVGTANVRIEDEERKQYYSSILSLVWFTFLAVLVIVLLFLTDIKKYLGLSEEMIILMLVHALGMGFVNFAVTRYTYEKKAYMTFGISVSVAFLGVVLSLILLYSDFFSENLYYGRAYGAAAPYIVIGFFFYLIYAIQGKEFFTKKYWKFALPLCLPLIFHGLSQLVLGQANRIMLQNMTNDSIVGIYSFTYSFVQVMNIIYNAFNNTWVPFYYEDLKECRLECIKKRTYNYIYVFTALSIGFMLLAPEVIKVFAGRDFWSGISMVPVLVFGNYMIFLYSFPVNFEFYHKKSVHVAIGTGVAAVLNCVMNLLLIPWFGMHGAALATFLSYVLLWIFHHIASKYFIRENYHYRIRDFLPGIGLMLIATAGTAALQNYTLIRWGIAAFVGGLALRHIIKTKSIF